MRRPERGGWWAAAARRLRGVGGASGLQAEVLLSLALVMVAATTLLAAVLVQRTRVALARPGRPRPPGGGVAQPPPERALIGGTGWWSCGGTAPRGAWGGGEALDAESRALAEEARVRRSRCCGPGRPGSRSASRRRSPRAGWRWRGCRPRRRCACGPCRWRWPPRCWPSTWRSSPPSARRCCGAGWCCRSSAWRAPLAAWPTARSTPGCPRRARARPASWRRPSTR